MSTKPQIRLLDGNQLFTVVPMSERLHFVERIRMLNHNEMQIQFTMEDSVALTKPRQVTITWERVTNTNRLTDELDCDPAICRNPVVNGRFTTIVR